MNQELKDKINQIYKLVQECEEIAKATDGVFNLKLIGTFFGSRKAYKAYYEYNEDEGDTEFNELDDGWWIPSRLC